MSSEVILKIEGLRAKVAGKEVLKGLDLELRAGEMHAVMGPNASGKSTLAHVLAGRPGYEATGGKVTFLGQDLLALEPEERACAGLFLAFQYPVELPGVANSYFLRSALNAQRKHRGEEEMDAMDFLGTAKDAMSALNMSKELLHRAVNQGFSGGEKKRNEILQMALLGPRLAILDEIDSGLDIDALRRVAEGVTQARRPDSTVLAVTHYPRLLEYLKPDKVHVLVGGRIVRTGDQELAHELEERGYGWLQVEQAAKAETAR
jgi:Fe-S cluster assembly ATP-binding protein